MLRDSLSGGRHLDVAGSVPSLARSRSRLRRGLPLIVGLVLLTSAGAVAAGGLPAALQFDDRSVGVTQLESELESLRSDIADVRGQVPGIESKVDDVERRQGTLSKDIDRQQKTIKDLRSQVKALQE